MAYSKDFTDEREAREAEEAAARAANIAENERLRAERDAKLEAERKAKSDADEAAWQAALTSEHKESKQRQWLIDHPDKTADDFEKVWPLLLENLKEESTRKANEAYERRLRAEYMADEAGDRPTDRVWSDHPGRF